MDTLSGYKLHDWSDLGRVHAEVADLLAGLASSRRALSELVRGVRDDDHRLSLSEQLVTDDKIVLYDGLESQGFRLRLHVSRSTAPELPHDHRSPLTTRILSGGYTHRLFRGTPSDPSEIAVRFEPPGACYTIDEYAIHSNIAARGTVTFTLRGPTRKAASEAMDRSTGRTFVNRGAAETDSELTEQRRIGPARFDEIERNLIDLGVCV